MVRGFAVEMILVERERQEHLKASGKFKLTCADAAMPEHEKLAVLGEEFGEVCGALLNKNRSAIDRPDADLQTELVHVAAVCLAWLESM